MKKLQSVDFILSKDELNEQINEIHLSRMTRQDKRKALVEIGLKDWDLRILYNGIYFNTNAPIRVITPKGETFTFGVEMECFVPREDIHRTARENSVRIAYEGYNHTDGKNYYKFVSDCSVRSNDATEDRNSIECVSPILKGRAGLTSLKKTCKALNEAGASVNKSCGLHIHIGAQTLTQQTIVNVYKNYQKLETLIDSFMAESRRNNRYCRSIRNFDYSNCHSAYDILNEMLNDRYYKVNPCSMRRHNTIEFRQHQGTTNYEKISMWINFLVKMVEWSKTNVLTAEVTDIAKVEFLNAKEKAFFKARIAAFSAR